MGLRAGRGGPRIGPRKHLLLGRNGGGRQLVGLSHVRVDPERHKQIRQGCKVGDVEEQRKGLAGVVEARAVLARVGVEVVHKQVDHGKRAAKDKLADLRRGQRALEDAGHGDLERADGVVEVHDGVDQRVEDHKDPDGRRREPDAGPHAQHGASMVVRLEQRRLAALGEDDYGIKDFVELAEVEEVAVVRKALLPDTVVDVTQTAPEAGRLAGGAAHETRVAVEVVVDAARRRSARDADPRELKDGAVDGSGHARTGPRRVDAEANVVREDKELEHPRLAQSQWLLVGLSEVVGNMDRRSVNGRNGNRHANVHEEVEVLAK